jgi:iron(III) transport system permease protein
MRAVSESRPEVLAGTPHGGLGERLALALRRPHISAQQVILALAVVLLVYLVLGPLAILLISSIKVNADALPLDPGPIGLANFARVYGDPRTLVLFGNSLFFTAGSLLIGISTATALAWLVERTNMPLRGMVYTLILVPMVIPGMLMAIAWILLLDPRNGVLNLWLRALLPIQGQGPLDIYTVPGMFMVQGMQMVPTAFLMIAASFRNMDPALEEQARAGGANAITTLRRVTLPILSPAILSALIYFGVLTIEAFEIPGVIGLTAGLHLLSTRIYWSVHPNAGLPDYGYASALSLLLLVLAIGLIFLYTRVTRSASRFATVTGRGFRPTPVDLGRWKYVALGFATTFFLFATILPMFILLWTSLLPLYFIPPSPASLGQLSFAGYGAVLQRSGLMLALTNTLAVMLVTATVTMLLVTLTSWVICRTRLKGRGVLDAFTFMPLTIPAVVVGLGVAYLYLSFPIGVYGTIWILVIAMTTKYVAFGSRTMNSAYLQIHNELEEAARAAGASWPRMLRRVTLPLLTPAIVNGWVWVAIHAMRDLTIPLMLFTPSSVVLSTIIWNMWINADLPRACALGIMLVAVTIVISAIGSQLGGRRLLREGRAPT